MSTLKNVESLHGGISELRETRQNLSFLQRAKKQKADEAIKQAERFFKNRFYINPDQAPQEIKRINEYIHAKESDLLTKKAVILEIMEKQDAIELKYHTTKLLAETRPDHEQITQLLEKTNKPPDKIRDKLLHERINLRLNIIPDHSFQKVIDNLYPNIKPKP